LNPEQTTDFSAIRHRLSALDASWEPAEAHGAFCGRACLSGAAALQDWARDVADKGDPDDVLAREHILALQRFAADSLLKLEAGQMGFQLLLPDDDAGLEERASSLADWCHGFMHGLASAGGADQGPFADAMEKGVIKEIIEDFSEITRAGADSDTTDEIENAYAELEEYVRVSVQLVYEETAGFRGADASKAVN